MTTNHLERAQFLLNSGRAGQAVQELTHALNLNPQDFYARSLLALSLSAEKRVAEALREAEQAVHLAPDYAFAHYTLAYVLNQAGRHRHADSTVQEALRQMPYDADFHALRADIKCNLRQWRLALEAAETGIRIDPENVDCANLRALALRNLGQGDHAAVVLDTALARDPENAATHVNRGMAYLQKGDHKNALMHFQEALRLAPGSVYAREGVLRALRARNPVYRVLLSYFFFMSRIPKGVQWAILIGGWYGMNVLTSMAGHEPAMAPYVTPLRVAYFLFIFLAWTSTPLFNVMLRFDKLGRLALTRSQMLASNFMVLCLALAGIGLGVWWKTGSETAMIGMAFSGFMMIPIAAAFDARSRRGKLFLGIYAGGLCALCALTVAGRALFGEKAVDLLFSACLLGFIAFTWIANFVDSSK